MKCLYGLFAMVGLTTCSNQSIQPGTGVRTEDDGVRMDQPAVGLRGVSDHLFGFKGILAHPSNPIRHEILDDPSATHFVFLVLIIFFLVSSAIAGTAGIVVILFRNPNGSRILDCERDLLLYGSSLCETPADMKHPGCVRVVATSATSSV